VVAVVDLGFSNVVMQITQTVAPVDQVFYSLDTQTHLQSLFQQIQ
jgi:hypothetical protein